MAKGSPSYELKMKSLYLSNVVKSLRYYLKHIFYILFANGVAMFFYYRPFLQIKYRTFLYNYFGFSILFYISYYGLLLTILTTFKVILYGNTITIMRKGTKNDIMELLTLSCTRFFSVFGTLITYYILILLLFVLGIIPGILFAFWYIFGIFLSAVGDLNNKIATSKTGDIYIPVGIKALDRSRNLTKGNLLKLMFSLIITTLVVFGVEELVGLAIIKFNFKFGIQATFFIKLCIWDIMYIYLAYIFVKLQSLEREQIAEKEEKQKAESDQLGKAAVNKFKSAKK
ncbi:MAG: hypothetical protein LBT02_04500 [Rickettsiales bacterium]|jgi:hypothetical protein|nr:hypothetical protein [Rickettsiales bacterium]